MDQHRRLGDYEILDKLGSGGMGQVWRVRNVISDRVEAMKILLPDLEHREDLASRFLREIKVLAALNHPNICTLHEIGDADGHPFIVMELVEGESLDRRLAGQGLGLPAVLGVTAATTTIPDGATVTVDPRTGTVTIVA